MAKKIYEIEVNDENLTKTAKSKASSVVKSVAEAEVESFGVFEINNSSSTKKVAKKGDAGYEKNVTVAKKREIKSQISEVEDYADFCFRRTAQPVAHVVAEETLDLLEYIKEILNVNVVENNEVKKKIATPSESGDNDGLLEYYSKMSVTPLYSGNIDTAEMINYIKEILNVNVESKDDVEVKIITPSNASDNDGLAELYYNKMVGPVEEKDFDYYATIEFIKEVLNYTADDEEVHEEVAEPVVETVAKKATTKKAAAKTSCKKKAEMIEEAAAVVEEVLSEDAERIRSVARMGILFG